MMKIRGAIILSCNKPFQLYLYCLKTIMKIHFNSYFQLLDLVIDYAIDKNKILDLDSYRSLESRYKSDCLTLLLREVFLICVIFKRQMFLQQYFMNLSLALIVTTFNLKFSTFVIFPALLVKDESFFIPSFLQNWKKNLQKFRRLHF